MRFRVGIARGAVGRGWAVARVNIPLEGRGREGSGGMGRGKTLRTQEEVCLVCVWQPLASLPTCLRAEPWFFGRW